MASTLVNCVKFAEVDPSDASILILTLSDRSIQVAASQDFRSLYKASGSSTNGSGQKKNSTGATTGSENISAEPSNVSAAQSTPVSSSSDGIRTVRLPVEWLLDNDCMQRHTMGQKISSVFDTYPTLEGLPMMVSVRGPWTDNDDATQSSGAGGSATDCITITLSNKTMVSVTCKDLVLYGCRPGIAATNTTCSTFMVTKPNVNRDVKHFDFKSFCDTSKNSDMASGFKANALQTPKLSHFSEGLLTLARDGIIIVDNCPEADAEAVLKLARCIDVEQPTLYGTNWTVQTAPTTGPKNNVAYTAEYLDFHHDLVYYQSPPGLQLLHCLKFDDSVTGGDSIFLDAFMVAEELRARDPESFKALCEIPAAFIKDDMARANPAQYYYATPHIHVDHNGQIAEMRWAPAFEAPLPVNDVDSCRRYYKARASFLRVMAEMREKHTLQFRLKPGQCIIWQQTRVLHGRDSFKEPEPHSRVLRGCYVNIDAFWNKVAVTVQGKFGAPLTVPRGNRSHL